MIFSLVAPKKKLVFQNNTYDFMHLKPFLNGKQLSKHEIFRECVRIMKDCKYPFDFRCPMPPIFQDINVLTFRELSYCLWFVVDFALNYDYSLWPRNVSWYGFQFRQNGFANSYTHRLYNCSLRHKESDDIICSCLATKDKLNTVVASFLDRSIPYSYVYIY